MRSPKPRSEETVRLTTLEAKRTHGRYYTDNNPFVLPAFKRWAAKIGLSDRTVLEPFAGSNSLVEMLTDVGLGRWFASYDIRPASPQVARRDTIRNFPTGFDTCVSNPPWLGRYSAKRRGLPWPDIYFDDLYKHCLELALAHCQHVAFIVPATFLQSGQFQDRLASVTFLHRKMFVDTDNPVCLALFRARPVRDVQIYYDDKFAGSLDQLRRFVPAIEPSPRIRFNEPGGGAWPHSRGQHGGTDDPILPWERHTEPRGVQLAFNN